MYGLASMSSEVAQSFINALNGSTIPEPARLLRIGPRVCTAICICSTRDDLLGLRALPASTRYSNSRVNPNTSLRWMNCAQPEAATFPRTGATSCGSSNHLAASASLLLRRDIQSSSSLLMLSGLIEIFSFLMFASAALRNIARVVPNASSDSPVR